MLWFYNISFSIFVQHWAKGAPRTSQLTIPTVPDTLIHRKREIVQETISTATQPLSTKADTYELRCVLQ